MKQIQNFGDQRQTWFCVYCGGPTETRDHIPSKVLLDEPNPTNLPIVPACQKCNAAFSLDEEYLACLLDCVLTGSVDADEYKRPKINRILNAKPALVSKLFQARQDAAVNTSFNVEMDRVRNVVLKLARGHAAFELNEPQLDEPSNISFVPFPEMCLDVKVRFEAPPRSAISPEVGSRAMYRLVLDEPGSSTWNIAQTGRYRYLASVGSAIVIRIVMSEYLACEVAWDYI